MKIAYIINSSSFGGMEYHVLDLAEGMVKSGHEVFVWCPLGDLAKDFEKVGAKVTCEKISLDIDPIYICKLKRFLKENKIDIVHAHELKAVTNALLAAWLAGVKHRIAHTHTPMSEWQINPIKKRINIFGYKRLINWFGTHEIALTQSRKRIKISEGIKESKLHIVESPNAVRVDEYNLGKNIKSQYRKSTLKKYGLIEDTVVWGCLGRQTEEKGHKVLIEAFKMLLDGLPEDEKNKQHLLLAGGGHLQEALLGQAAEAGIKDKVTITGRLPYKELIKHYSCFDYFIHPSLAEGFGLVLIEAMVVGIPVIASDLEVFKEVADNTITYFKTGDAQNLYKIMLEVHQGTLSLEEKKQKAQQRAINLYSFEKFVECYNSYYLELFKD